jgi:protease IV
MRTLRRLLVGFLAVIGFFVVAFFAIGIGLWMFAQPSEERLGETNLLSLDLTKPIVEGPPGDGLERLVIGEQVTLRDVVEGLLRAADDTRIKGVVARVGDGMLGTAQIQELRDAIARFRAKGKFAFAYADGFGESGSGMKSYYLATSFDEIWLQPVGEVGLVGIRVDMPFFRGTLEKLGVTPRFDHRSEYKTAMNTLTETAMTPAHREETEALLRSIFEQMVHGIGEGRKLEPQAVKTLVDQGPFAAEPAREAHLVDHLGYRDDALAAARARAGNSAKLISLLHYLDAADRPHQSGPTVAVIYGKGLITRGDSSENPLSGSGILGADTLARAFRQAADDKTVRAILFRIDSPGGSASASETIWREVLRAKEAGKPVIVSMGDVAGSGGYYIAAPADKIVAEPATLTGSIGVVAGKVLLGGLSEKLGISWDAVQLGKNAGMDSVVVDYTPAEYAHFEAMLDHVYASFKTRVADGRKLSGEAVEQVARGRVWTGDDARTRGLVDALGGFETALALAKERAGIAADRDVTLKTFPPTSNTPGALLARLMGRDSGNDDSAFDSRTTLAAIRPLLRRLELAAQPPGSLTMPPIELH